MGPTTEFSRRFLGEIAALTERIDHGALEAIIDALVRTWRSGGWVYTIGNGGSAATASHFVCDLAKYSIPEGARPLRAMCLSDNVALFTAWANDASFDDVYLRQLEGRIGPSDVLVSWSVHGGAGFSANLVRAMAYARERGVFTVSMSGFDGGLLKKTASCSLVIPIDSTPHVEAMHLVMEHLICERLRLILSDLPRPERGAGA